MDLRGDGVGIVAITAGSTGKSSVLDSMGSILISYPLASPENCETFRKDDTIYTEIEIYSRKYIFLSRYFFHLLKCPLKN